MAHIFSYQPAAVKKMQTLLALMKKVENGELKDRLETLIFLTLPSETFARLFFAREESKSEE